MRLQTQSSTNPIYSGAADCVKQTVAKEGPRALYKGKKNEDDDDDGDDDWDED